MAGCSQIIVIGAGILGITAALDIQSKLLSGNYGHNVTIVAAEIPGDESINYASPWAGAHYRPVPSLTPREVRDRKYAQVTLEVLREQSKRYPEAGIEFMDAYEYLEEPSEAYLNLEGGYSDIEDFRLLVKDELPPNMKFGVKYTTWSATLSPIVKVVVNCSGVGFGDPDVFPIKGQTCLVSNKCDKTITQQNIDGTWTFIIPRPLVGGTIIGGTKLSHDWSTSASSETRNNLLAQAAKMYTPILNENSEFVVIRDIVGRRPARKGGLRVACETLDVEAGNGHQRPVAIVHAYGAGGTGYELCWGVAMEVAEMVLVHMPLKASI